MVSDSGDNMTTKCLKISRGRDSSIIAGSHTNVRPFQVQPYFFQDITDKAMLTWYRDDKRDNTRTEFLCKVITASMEFIHRETSDGTTVSSTQAISWMGKCQTLASIWKINNDELRIHQVCQLYINGFDRLAEEVGVTTRIVYWLHVHTNTRVSYRIIMIFMHREMRYIFIHNIHICI